MARFLDATGRPLIPDETDRVQPVVPVDTPEGKFSMPLVLLAGFQYEQFVKDVATAVVASLPKRGRPKTQSVEGVYIPPQNG